MKTKFTEIKNKLQNPEFQAEAKAVAKSVAGAIVFGAVVTIGTQLAVKGLHIAAEKSTELAKDLFSSDDVLVVDQELVDAIANS